MDAEMLNEITEKVIKNIQEQYYLVPKLKNGQSTVHPGGVDNFVADLVIDFVCERFVISRETLCDTGRLRNVVDARCTYMWITRNLTSSFFTLSQIGKKINKDHSTVLYAIRKVSGYIQVDSKYRESIITLCRLFIDKHGEKIPEIMHKLTILTT